jgi:hypothetical protein
VNFYTCLSVKHWLLLCLLPAVTCTRSERVGQGDYRVVWTLFVDNNSADDLNILDLDVNDATSNSILTTLTVTREMFQTPFGPQNFTAYFKLSAGSPLPQLEFRVYYHCCVYAAHLVSAFVLFLLETGGFVEVVRCTRCTDDNSARALGWRVV